MNQAILFNDDHTYLTKKQCWRFTGLMSGSLVVIFITTPYVELSQELKFTWEELVEEYLEEQEPNNQNEIWL